MAFGRCYGLGHPQEQPLIKPIRRLLNGYSFLNSQISARAHDVIQPSACAGHSCFIEDLIFVSASTRIVGLPLRLAALSAAMLVAVSLPAQTSTAPELLPYSAKLIAGTGTTAAVAGSVCTPATGAPSGYRSIDAFGDGCLANEIKLTNPKQAVTDSTGVIYFIDYASATTGVVHRIDPTTGIVTLVAGGVATIPASGAHCSTTDPNTVSTTVVDLWGDGCLGTSVKLEEPYGIAIATNGDIYIADYYAYNVRKISASNGGVSGVAITSGGSNYATVPTVTFSSPATGTPATGTAVLTNQVVTSVTMTNNGTGYTLANPPTVTFSVPGTGVTANTATGIAAYTGVISMAAGSKNGTSTTYGYTGTGATLTAAAANACNTTPGTTGTPCFLDNPAGLAFDTAGNLYISEQYYAVLVLNTNTTGSTTVLGQKLPAQQLFEVAGSCTTATCTKGNFTTGVQSTAEPLYNDYSVAVDSYNNFYIADTYEGGLLQTSAGTSLVNGGTQGYLNGLLQAAVPAAGITNAYGDLNPGGTAAAVAATKRGIAATFGTGYDNGVGVDPQNNLYQTDYTDGYIWRVDAASQTMFVVGGGGATITTGTTCATGMAADALGDGCPGTAATFSKTIFGVRSDPNGNILIGDAGNAAVREIVTGAQLGNTGASATTYLDIHFQNGDTPIATKSIVIGTGTAIFTVGSTSCTVNTDNNAAFGNSEDCVVAITATPTASGPYTGTVIVTGTKSGSTTYTLTGNFAQSPITRTTLTAASAATIAAGCIGNTYPTNSNVTLTATIISNGPVAPTGNIVFANNSVPLGTVAVTNIGTATAPVYGAVLSIPFTAGNENVTAKYTYTPPATGPVYTYTGSASSVTSFSTAVPTFGIAPVAGSLSTIKAGGAALYSFNIADTLYTGTITFACSNLPAGATCVFSPTTVTGAGCSVSNTVALNINTTATVTSYPAGFGGGSNPWSLTGLFAAALLAAVLGIFRRRIPLRATQLLLAIAFLLGASGLVACSKSAGTVLSAGTPAGSYNNITVTATGTDGTVASTTISLTVN
jgi:hypothetical protein